MLRPPSFTPDPALVDITSTHAVLLLDRIELLRLRSRDGSAGGPGHLRRREGLLAVQVGGQPTMVRWATDKDGHLTPATLANLRDRVLYVGPRRDPIEIVLDVVETDDKLDRDLGLTADVFDAAGGVAGVVPGPGSAIGAGLQFLGKVFEQLRTLAADRKEMHVDKALFFHDPPTPAQRLGWGTLELVEALPTGETAIRVTLRAAPLTLPVPDDAVRTQVFVDALQGHDLPKRGELRVEYTFGNAGAARSDTMAFALVDQEDRSPVLTSVEGKLLYDGPAIAGVPFRITAAVVPRRDTSGVSTAVSTAADMTGSGVDIFTAAVRNDKTREAIDTALQAVTKAALGATQIALDVIARKADDKLLSIEGILLPAGATLPGGAATVAGLPAADEHALVPLGSPDQGVTLRLRVRRA